MNLSDLDSRTLRHRLSSAFALLNTSFEMIYQESGDREEANELHQLGVDEIAAIMSDLDKTTNQEKK